jgi:hypothetical protein
MNRADSGKLDWGAPGSHLRLNPGLRVNFSNSALKQAAAGLLAEKALNGELFFVA